MCHKAQGRSIPLKLGMKHMPQSYHREPSLPGQNMIRLITETSRDFTAILNTAETLVLLGVIELTPPTTEINVQRDEVRLTRLGVLDNCISFSISRLVVVEDSAKDA